MLCGPLNNKELSCFEKIINAGIKEKFFITRVNDFTGIDEKIYYRVEGSFFHKINGWKSFVIIIE